MSHHHSNDPARFTVIVVSDTRDAGDDVSGALIAELASGAGHTLVARTVVRDEVEAIRSAVAQAARASDVVILTGGTGIAGRDVTPEALRRVLHKTLPGFGELFRALSFQEIGVDAMLSRATAGVVGACAVFALPGSPAGCRLGMEKLILPTLGHVVAQLAKDPVAADAEPEEDAGPEVEEEAETLDDEPRLPPASGVFGRLGGVRGGVGLGEHTGDAPERASGPGDKLPQGWKRAVYEIKGTVHNDRRLDLPEAIEKLAPAMDVLYTSGQQAMLELEGGRKYSLWGFPDLERPESKVLAISWGEPIAEVLALHRYPAQTGTCIEERWGLAPQADGDLAGVCAAVTGQAPRDASGQLFAVEGDAVYLRRGNSVYRWDGRREVLEGNPKQVIASLMLRWSNR